LTSLSTAPTSLDHACVFAFKLEAAAGRALGIRWASVRDLSARWWFMRSSASTVSLMQCAGWRFGKRSCSDAGGGLSCVRRPHSSKMVLE